MMRESVFADVEVIQIINQSFLACEVDTVREDFPNLQALQLIAQMYKFTHTAKFSNACNVIVHPNIPFPLQIGVGGCGAGLEDGVGYNPVKFLKFLKKGLDLYHRCGILENGTYEEKKDFMREVEAVIT